jgi:hypothetical protein
MLEKAVELEVTEFCGRDRYQRRFCELAWNQDDPGHWPSVGGAQKELWGKTFIPTGCLRR